MNDFFHRKDAPDLTFLRTSGHYCFAEPQLLFEKEEGEDVLRVRIKFPNPAGAGFIWFYPQPPLDFDLEIDGKRHDFRPEIDALLAAASVARFTKFVRDRANERNRLLYATAQGIPRVAGSVKQVLETGRGRVFAELAVFLLIDTVKTQQRFVVQALEAFLRLMELIPDDAAA